MNFFEAIVIAIVEGLTEFLPVSSTAHMIFTSSFFGIQEDAFVKMFMVSIQLGSILSVVVMYWRKFFDKNNLGLYVKLACAVLPALILGKLFDDKIEAILGSPRPIAVMLIIGGVVLLFVDKWFTKPVVFSEKEVTIRKAVAIGFWQCLAMMPGTSRSAASIIGGMQQGLSRQAAAEFSFFLAVPTMLAVTTYSLFVKEWGTEGQGLTGIEMMLATPQNLPIFLVGIVVAFLVALVAMKFFIGIIKKYGFKPWGWYRIIAGIILFTYFSL